MMLWEQAKALEDVRMKSLKERISVATAIPRLFTYNEMSRWNRELVPRGFRPCWGESSHYNDREAWDQLKNGVILRSASLHWSSLRDWRYDLGLTKYPNEDEKWVITFRGSVVASGIDHLSLLTELDTRNKFKKTA